MPNVLIAPVPLRNQPGPFRDALVAAGLTPIDLVGADPLSPEDLIPVLPDIDAVIAGGELFSAEMMRIAPRLRVVARAGVGYDAVDVVEAAKKGIVVTITPGTNHGSVAEHAFALLLALARRVTLNDQSTRAGGWDRTVVRALRESTLGLVGLGRIGRAMVVRASAFGMRVIAYDPIIDPAFEAHHGVARVELDELLAEADVVSLHLPLTPETKRIFNADLFSKMKPDAIFLNTSRGGLVDEAALFDALTSGRLSGAGLDVFDREPPAKDNPLLTLPNVVVSPHIGGLDATSMSDMALSAARSIVDLHAGRWPTECVVNNELRDGWKW